MMTTVLLAASLCIGQQSFAALDPRCARTENDSYTDQVWIEQSSGNPSVVKYLRNGDIQYGLGVAKYSGSPANPDVDVDEAGNRVIVWTETSQSMRIYGLFMNSAGNDYQIFPVDVGTINTALGSCPRVSISRTGGNITIAWGSNGQAGPGVGNNCGNIFARYFQVNTNSQYGVTAVSDIFQASPLMAQGQGPYNFGDVDSDAIGNPVITYVRQNSSRFQNGQPASAGGFFVRFAFGNTTTPPASAEMTIVSNGSSFYGYSQIASYADGEVVGGYALQNVYTVVWVYSQGTRHTYGTSVTGSQGIGGLACQRNMPGSWIISGGFIGSPPFLQYQIATGGQLGQLVQVNGTAGAACSAGVDNNGNFIIPWVMAVLNSSLTKQVGDYPP